MIIEQPFSLEAFSSLVREHQGGLRAFIRALGIEAAWVDDLAQEVFVVAYQKLERFENDKDFGKWLRGIARHLVANERRKEARRARILHGPLTDLLLADAPEEAEPIESNRLMQAMNECLEQLPRRHRELLHKRYELGENASSLAGEFNLSPEAIRQTLMRSRAAVKQCIEGKLPGAWI